MVHELGHILSAYLVNAKIEDVKLYPKAMVTYRDINDKQLRVIVPSGSLLNVIYAVLLMMIGKRKEQYGIFLAGFLIIEGELGYWNTLMPIGHHGDAKMFYELFPKVSPYQTHFSILLFIVQILYSVYSIKSVYDIVKTESVNLAYYDRKLDIESIIERTAKKYNL